MKKLIFTFFVAFYCTISNAQTVNNIPIKDIDLDYVQIIGTTRMLSTKLTVQIDFGQKTKQFSFGKETIIKDEEGNIMDFNSMMDALNFMSKNGFEFVSSSTIIGQNQNFYYYILRNIKNRKKE